MRLVLLVLFLTACGPGTGKVVCDATGKCYTIRNPAD